jgi:hypothetical protein
MSSSDQGVIFLLQKLQDFRIEEKLNNNEGLLPGQRYKVESLLDEGNVELQKYDTEIQRLQVVIDNTRREKTHLDIQLQRAKSLLAPIRLLPIELLALIFEIYVEERGGIYLHGLVTVPPATLGAVCRHWRNVTMCTPSIWTRLSAHSAVSIKGTWLKTILSRSCNSDVCLPLILDIHGLYADLENETLGVLIEESHRWKRLTLHNNEIEEGNARQYLSKISGKIPLLQHLSFKGNFEESSSEFSSLSAFLDAPSLTYFDTQDMCPHIMLPCSQLTHIKGQIFDYPAAQLALCCNAQALSLQLTRNGDGWGMHHASELKCRELELNMSSYWWCNHLDDYNTSIQGISCPELESLTISDDVLVKSEKHHSGVLYHPLKTIQSLIQHSNQLRSLSLKRIALDGDLLTLFKRIPLLEKLTILGLPDYPSESNRDHFIFHRPFISALTPSHGNVSPSSTLLPRLTRLEFSVDNPLGRFSVSAFHALVRSRWLPDGEVDGIACLREVVVRSSDLDLVNELSESLHTLEEEGTKIDVFVHDTFEDTNFWL